MRKIRSKTAWSFTLLLAVAVAVAASGCGDKPAVSTSTTEATVTGTVTFRGKKATKGEVVFDPANYRRASESVRTAPISKDGTYSIRTLTGQNMVRVQTPEVMKTRDEPPQLPVEVEKDGQVFDINLP